jgi:amino acid transporter
MAQPISRKTAVAVALLFTVFGVVVGASEVIPASVRNAAAYPILMASLLFALWDLRSSPLRTPSVAGAILLVIGSVVVGYRGTAEAMKEPALAVLVYVAAMIALAVLVAFCADRWIGRRGASTSALQPVGSEHEGPEKHEGGRRSQ